jgi:hypothetical protein
MIKEWQVQYARSREHGADRPPVFIVAFPAREKIPRSLERS